MRILIAEDDYTSRAMLTGIMKKEGHEVVVAVNGAEAWEALQKPDAPGLVILDWMMPEMDGPEVVRRVRALQTDRQPYMIMMTTRSEKVDIVAGLEAGANDYIAKPLDIGEFRARLKVGSRMVDMQDALADKIIELHKALDHIKTLRGIIPVCSNCKKIPDGPGHWRQIEAYIQEHTDATFSHGICPECAKKLYPQYRLEDAAKAQEAERFPDGIPK